ncbi:alanine--tRNA ligase [Desulfurella multipotens]|uniref:alanine--tRNA ligase n=1 Tax=Desulfurella multipotens TaxID=79269 RepID=UPI000CB4EDBF|nr:alanine--tRNA ligase [Desulfurella multipotens]PMP67577.1 MAG: alanine--tRNA ligase [Desulfurella multipotens]
MNSKIVRETFLEYFEKNSHTRVKSSSLVPQNDPTLLFTNAGMVQFKNVFLGNEKRDYKRACSSQKCVRAGGKHNDLENVGYTARHHTFFEMLGNFSFGDYFKKEAIHYAWDLVTNVYGLPKEKLWITIFKEDDEAFEIWHKQEGVDASRIVRMGEKDNFWSMGDTGPCGPCSEIHIDQGESVGCRRPECSIECDCDRFLEIWNLVFMQFNRTIDGKLTPLPKPSIDTGMGLERISAVLEGVYSNFDTDLFIPIIHSVCDYFSVEYKNNESIDVALRVIADHLRAMDFLIADGVLPDKEGRGYVLRKIIRRAMRFGTKLGAREPFLFKLVDSVNESLGDIYPEIVQNQIFVKNTIKLEEEQFLNTLEEGLALFDKLVDRSNNILDGQKAFKLYDTYGFPIDLTLDIAKEQNIFVDIEGFNRHLETQRQKSKSSFSMNIDLKDSLALALRDLEPTEFVGYDNLEYKGHLIAIFDLNFNNKNVVNAKEIAYFVFDKTPFYATSGGQVADSGFIFSETSKAYVSDVFKHLDKYFIHKVEILEGEFEKDKSYTLSINVARRKDIARHHSAVHLLDSALIRRLGNHVKQAGSLVEPTRLRFDFTHNFKLTEEEIKDIEIIVNSWIQEAYPVKTTIMNTKDAIESGAIALFSEKYDEFVRVVEMGNVSRELCGGTHVKNTGEIGFFKIISEEALSKGVRRIEAKVGMSAYDHVLKLEKALNFVLKELSTNIDELPKKITELKQQPKEKSKTFKIEFNQEKIKNIDMCNFYIDFVEGNIEMLKKYGDAVKNRVKDIVVVLYGKFEEKVYIVCMVSGECKNYFKANEIIKNICKKFGAKGGGKEQYAQAGVSIDKINKELVFDESLYKKEE